MLVPWKIIKHPMKSLVGTNKHQNTEHILAPKISSMINHQQHLYNIFKHHQNLHNSLTAPPLPPLWGIRQTDPAINVKDFPQKKWACSIAMWSRQRVHMIYHQFQPFLPLNMVFCAFCGVLLGGSRLYHDNLRHIQYDNGWNLWQIMMMFHNLVLLYTIPIQITSWKGVHHEVY